MEPLPRPATHQTVLAELGRLIGPACVRIHGDSGQFVTGVELDSTQVRPGDLFAALPGRRVHGAMFANQAVELGATALLTDAEGLTLLSSDLRERMPVLEATAPRTCLGLISSAVYRGPADAITVLGITGTNGKTTVSYLLEAGLRAAGRTTGVIGTIGIRVHDTQLASTRTTPEAPHLHAIIGVMREVGVDSVAVEVSSHALEEGRVDGVRFDVAGFTNLSHDHLDYHGTMEAYFAAKAALFTPEHCQRAVIGIDDEWGRRLCAQATVPTVTWSTRVTRDEHLSTRVTRDEHLSTRVTRDDHLSTRVTRDDHGSTSAPGSGADWTLVADGGRWVAEGPGGEQTTLDMPLPGAFNRANALCAFVMLRELGIDASVAAAGIAQVSIPGRMEWIGRGAPVSAIVDYAHSPDAIESAIVTVRPDTSGRVIAVIGAGGDRDQGKRPIMGARAAAHADVVIVTDDNPRSEDPAAIRAAVLLGARECSSNAEVQEVADRRRAIAGAVAMARPGDVVLILGKGHEQGQEIAGRILPFDDRVEVRRALRLFTGDALAEAGNDSGGDT